MPVAVSADHDDHTGGGVWCPATCDWFRGGGRAAATARDLDRGRATRQSAAHALHHACRLHLPGRLPHVARAATPPWGITSAPLCCTNRQSLIGCIGSYGLQACGELWTDIAAN